MNRLKKALYTWAAVTAALFFLSSCGLRLNFGKSADQGLYWVKKVDHLNDKPVVGAKYLVRWEWDTYGLERGMHHLRLPMLKEVAGIEGQMMGYDMATGQVHIDGKPVEGCVLRKKDNQGNVLRTELPVIAGKGEVLVVSHLRDGWDSRYFGAVPWGELTHRAYPLFIWKKVEICIVE